MVNKKIDKVNVLGTDYSIFYKDAEEDPKLSEICDGYCDTSVKKIVVENFKESLSTVEDLDSYQERVLRHELVHAFLYESGLAGNSWAGNEELVDWIALQFDKLTNAFDSVVLID